MKTNSEKRENFKNFSAPILESKQNGTVKTVNEGLKQQYEAEGHKELKTFDQWKAAGRAVKRGQKALYLWGKKMTKTVTENGQEKEISFFPMVAVFAEDQVYNPENSK